MFAQPRCQNFVLRRYYLAPTLNKLHFDQLLMEQLCAQLVKVLPPQAVDTISTTTNIKAVAILRTLLIAETFFRLLK